MKQVYDLLLNVDAGAAVAFILGVFGLIITYAYNSHSRKITQDKLQKELFKEFNERYDALNEYLEEITSDYNSIQHLSDSERGDFLRYKLNDYFNLCAEEHYWFQQGRIDPKIWCAWEIGMNSWYNDYPIIQEVWEEELKKFKPKSFYIERGDEFFNKRSNG